MDIQAFIDGWTKTGGSERANKDSFLNELADLLGVPRPDKKSGDPDQDRYVFEHDVPTAHEGGKVTTRKIDLYKHGCFILEAKQGSNAGDKKLGFARRDTDKWHIGMRDAYGQALSYAAAMENPPPFIVVCDLGYCFDLYATFDRGLHRPFPNALNHRIWLRDFAKEPKHLDTLRRIWTEPHALDPSRHAAKVTRRVAERIAKLARSLEEQKHPSELVAKFLMRCLFTMFAEDVGLLPPRTFTNLVKDYWLPNPPSFVGLGGVSALWQAMNDGATAPLIGKLLRFNGGLFADTSAIPLKRPDLELLLDAAEHDWAEVEPAIFGTLLERALNPKERHMLGAHFTPRAYVERLVRPTIEEPLREEWENVQAAARKLRLDEKVEEARKLVHEFLRKLCATRVLDPACGSGNFLYVALDLFKRIEGEVLALLRELGEAQERLHMEGERVTPKQFLGIEVKPWAKEIADLVLWIGYLQWHYKSHGKAMPPPEPVLMNYKNIERRDAVLDWDAIELVTDESGKPVTRWDGETYKKSAVTGEMVPDEAVRVPVERYVNPRKAQWPQADYIIGNPPFVGNWRMRSELGDGYVEALRTVHKNVPESADLVMYWWDRAASLVSGGEVNQAGLITTTSITQTFNRRVVQAHLEAESPVSIVFAIADHPWTTAKYDQTTGGAEVRTAMTVIAPGERSGRRGRVEREYEAQNDEVQVDLSWRIGTVNADLSVGANVAGAGALRSNLGLSSPGVKLHGAGFIVSRADALSLGMGREPGIEQHIRAYRNGQDIAATPRDAFVVDLFGLEAEEARVRFPSLYNWVIERVKPERMARTNHGKDAAGYAAKWWLFGKPRPELRKALAGLSRYIATPESARRRYFVFLDASVLPDNMLTAFALDDPYFLGVLSSHIHVCWALAAGGRLGIRHDPRYNKTRCFEPFPFPEPTRDVRARVATLAEQLDAHRKRQQGLHQKLALTKLYKALDAVRNRIELDTGDQKAWEEGLGSTLLSVDFAVLPAQPG
jgi:hypothetical protein